MLWGFKNLEFSGLRFSSIGLSVSGLVRNTNNAVAVTVCRHLLRIAQ